MLPDLDHMLQRIRRREKSRCPQFLSKRTDYRSSKGNCLDQRLDSSQKHNAEVQSTPNSNHSGRSNGPFGMGWNLSLPHITRKTDKGLPRYEDADESDAFILSCAEDLVPVLSKTK